MRVPRTTHAPPQRPGTLSASGHCDQSIMAALSGYWMSNHSRQSMLQSIMRGPGLFVSYEINADRNALWIMLRGVFWCRRDDIAERTLRRPAGFHAGHFPPHTSRGLVL